MTALPAESERLFRIERILLLCLLIVAISFGGIVVNRGAFLQQRKTDLGVFLRAAWAVRSGADLYTITDDKGLLYHYPPLLAILLVPLADAPGSADGITFGIKVALWYMLSLFFLALAVHALARALEKAVPELAARARPAGSRHWWALRVLPALACLPALGHGLALGQVNVLWLALLCGMAAATLRGRPWRAGGWLAAAICLKVLPVFLLLFPLWRRDLRCLAGCAVGLLVGLLIIPGAVLGPERTLASYREWSEAVILPAFGKGNDQARGQQLHEMTATHNQSLMAIMHNSLYPDPLTRPPIASPAVKHAHYLIGSLLTGMVLLAAGWRRAENGTAPALLLGALTLNMLLLSPAGHSHYLVLLLPLFMTVLATGWQSLSRHGHAVALILIMLNAVAGALPLLPGLGRLHDLGIAMYAGLLVWLTSVVLLWKQRPSSDVLSPGKTYSPAQAA